MVQVGDVGLFFYGEPWALGLVSGWLAFSGGAKTNVIRLIRCRKNLGHWVCWDAASH